LKVRTTTTTIRTAASTIILTTTTTTTTTTTRTRVQVTDTRTDLILKITWDSWQTIYGAGTHDH
jgi:hypothetical protein